MTVYGANASLLDVSVTADTGMQNATIICPQHSTSNCVITADRDSLKYSYIEAIYTKTVNITATQDWTFEYTIINCTQAGFLNILADGYGVLSNANVYCPNNGYNNGYSCIIDTDNQWAGGLNVKIYAVEGFNDLLLSGAGFFNSQNDILYCMLDYSKSCDIDGTRYYDGYIHCDDSSLDATFCDNYTLSNTTTTTTLAPTIMPS